jgi:hypothetical protein
MPSLELPNALVQLQAHYHHRGVAASEKCLSAATFVRPQVFEALLLFTDNVRACNAVRRNFSYGFGSRLDPPRSYSLITNGTDWFARYPKDQWIVLPVLIAKSVDSYIVQSFDVRQW